jgi:hypothetical protein
LIKHANALDIKVARNEKKDSIVSKIVDAINGQFKCVGVSLSYRNDVWYYVADMEAIARYEELEATRKECNSKLLVHVEVIADILRCLVTEELRLELNKPNKVILAISTLASCIHSCRVLLVRNSGKPDAKPSNNKAPIFWLWKACLSA